MYLSAKVWDYSKLYCFFQNSLVCGLSSFTWRPLSLGLSWRSCSHLGPERRIGNMANGHCNQQFSISSHRTTFRSSSRYVFTNFLYTNLRIFSTKYYVIFVWIFSNAQSWAEMSFWPICFLFQLRNIGKKKIHRFLFWKFVKTCREFNISCGHFKRAPFLGLVSTRSVLQSGDQIRQRKSSICQIRFNGAPFSHWNCQFDE